MLKATKEEVTKCIKYAQEYNNVLEERERKKKEENERKYAEYVAEKERKARELDEFRGSLKGKWAEFVSKVMRKLAVELLFLAGKCNKKQIANNKRLGYSRFDRRSYLVSDCFKSCMALRLMSLLINARSSSIAVIAVENGTKNFQVGVVMMSNLIAWEHYLPLLGILKNKMNIYK